MHMCITYINIEPLFLWRLEFQFQINEVLQGFLAWGGGGGGGGGGECQMCTRYVIVLAIFTYFDSLQNRHI